MKTGIGIREGGDRMIMRTRNAMMSGGTDTGIGMIETVRDGGMREIPRGAGGDMNARIAEIERNMCRQTDRTDAPT